MTPASFKRYCYYKCDSTLLNVSRSSENPSVPRIAWNLASSFARDFLRFVDKLRIGGTSCTVYLHFTVNEFVTSRSVLVPLTGCSCTEARRQRR